MPDPKRPLILIVDDEPQIQRFLTHALTASGYDTTEALTGTDCLTLARTANPDLMILDLGLPDIDGKSVIETLRRDSTLPLIVLSAHDQEMEKIMALDLGADDFVSKPFAIGELLARIRVCLRPKRTGGQREVMSWNGLEIDRTAHEVRVNGEVVRLTPKEFDLLLALAESPGRVLTHRQLLQKVWGPAHVEDVPYLRVFIGQLRQKLGLSSNGHVQIQTEAGIGYRWLVGERG